MARVVPQPLDSDSDRMRNKIHPQISSDSDKDVVLAAVAQNGSALEFAAEPLRADKDVVLAAVTQNLSALRFAAATLKKDTDVLWPRS